MADEGVDALWQVRHQAFKIGRPQTIQHLLAVHGLPQRDVRGNAVVEHQHVLADQCELGAQCVQRPSIQRVAIEFNLTAAQRHKPWQQADQGGFSRARSPNQGNRFTGLHLQTEVLERRGAAVRVGDASLFELDVALGAGFGEIAARFAGGQGNQIKAALHCCQASGDRVGHFRQMLDRGNQHQHGSDKGGKTAH